MSGRRVIFVGQAWNKTFGERLEARFKRMPGELAEGFRVKCCAMYPLTGKPGEKLARLIGVSYDDFLRYGQVNLNQRFTGKNGKGDAFDRVEGKARALALLDANPGAWFVLLGAEVAGCFGMPWRPCEVFRMTRGTCLVLPHPSGINRWWNEKKNVAMARRALRSFVLPKARRRTRRKCRLCGHVHAKPL